MTAVRLTARALVTDPNGRVLLIRVHDVMALDASDPVVDYWITVGGGAEAGESFEEAIVREVFEEIDTLIADYRAGMCLTELGRSIGCTRQMAKTRLQRRGVIVRSDLPALTPEQVQASGCPRRAPAIVQAVVALHHVENRTYES